MWKTAVLLKGDTGRDAMFFHEIDKHLGTISYQHRRSIYAAVSEKECDQMQNVLWC